MAHMNKGDEIFGKAGELAGKAEKFLEEGYEKVKGSEAYAKIRDAVGQAGEFVDKKLEKLKESDIPDKLKDFKGKAESGTENVIEHVKAYGSLLADDVEQVIDDVKEKFSGEKKQK
jgi:hypothetical protein